MTMLDRMRRHRNWLKWSLALVVLTFVVFYIPDFLNVNRGVADPGDAVAEVEGRAITASEFSRVYNTQLQSYRNAYGGAMNETLLKQLGIDRQILQQLIDERSALVEAERLGITATDAEVRERIVRLPGLQENGAFIGEERYKQLLRMQRPPISHTEFEESLRRAIVIDKLRTAVAGWMTVTETEVDREYRRRNEKVKVQVVAFSSDRFREGLQASDQEIAQYFEKNKEEFRVPEKRKIEYVAIDPQKIRERVVVSPQDAERYYNSNIDQYSTPEEVRASHILLKTEGKDEAAVRKQAEDLLAKVKAGGDFAALATQFSEDEASKARGGDLDFFPRGRMVPEFDAVAFSLQPGNVSDLVKTQYGFHIIKATERRQPTQRPFEEVRDQIIEQLKWERAQRQASDSANRLASQIEDPDDLERVAKSAGFAVQESPFFSREEPIPGLGPSPEVAQAAFTMATGEVSDVVRTGQGFAIFTVTGTQEAHLPKLDEVKERVREAVLQRKAVEAARAKANELRPTLEAAADFEAAAKAAGFEVQSSTDFVARGAALPGIGASPEAEAAAFSLQPGAVSGVVSNEHAAAIIKVVERQDVTPEQVTSGRATLREEMLNERRGRFFSAYMAKAKGRLDIRIHREALQRIVT
jgi:peptidyl-prolyl cis-trans isomerase D